MENERGKKTADGWSDPIVEEIHAIRERHARAFNYDVKAIVEDLKRRQKESGREVVSFPPKRIGEIHEEEP
ncbi:MAG: hypothetical protein ACR2GR_07755 [Rhodothermales bacterium]